MFYLKLPKFELKITDLHKIIMAVAMLVAAMGKIPV
jgi:hypothetical protein